MLDETEVCGHLSEYRQFLDDVERSRLRLRSGSFFSYDDVSDPVSHEGQNNLSVQAMDKNMQRCRDKSATLALRSHGALSRQLSFARRAQSVEQSRRTCNRHSKLYNPVPKANMSGIAYNIINHEYHDSPDGQRLRKNDELVRYRSRLRSLFLSAKNHMGLDPITGAVNPTLLPHLSLEIN